MLPVSVQMQLWFELFLFMSSTQLGSMKPAIRAQITTITAFLAVQRNQTILAKT